MNSNISRILVALLVALSFLSFSTGCEGLFEDKRAEEATTEEVVAADDESEGDESGEGQPVDTMHELMKDVKIIKADVKIMKPFVVIGHGTRAGCRNPDPAKRHKDCVEVSPGVWMRPVRGATAGSVSYLRKSPEERAAWDAKQKAKAEARAKARADRKTKRDAKRAKRRAKRDAKRAKRKDGKPADTTPADADADTPDANGGSDGKKSDNKKKQEKGSLTLDVKKKNS